MLQVKDIIHLSPKHLRLLDAQTPEDEQVIQVVLNQKLKVLPPEQAITTKGIPDITSPEEEARWQKVMDERVAKAKKLLFSENESEGISDESDTNSIESIVETIQESLSETPVNENSEVDSSIIDAVKNVSESVMDSNSLKTEIEIRKLKKQELIDYAASIGLEFDDSVTNSPQRVDAILAYQQSLNK